MAKAQKPKEKKGRFFKFQLYLIFWALLAVFFLVVIGKQITEYNQYAKQGQEIQEKIDDEKRTGRQLDAELLQSNADEYIEKVAREQLGLIKPDEILFIREGE